MDNKPRVNDAVLLIAARMVALDARIEDAAEGLIEDEIVSRLTVNEAVRMIRAAAHESIAGR